MRDYLVSRRRRHPVYYKRWWQKPLDRGARQSIEDALTEATELDDEYGQVVNVDKFVMELLARGWRR